MTEPYVENGRVWLTTGNGKFYSTPEAEVDAALARLGTARFATADEVAERKKIREHEGIGGQVKAGLKAFSAGAFDAASAGIRLPAEAWSQLPTKAKVAAGIALAPVAIAAAPFIGYAEAQDNDLAKIQAGLTGHRLQENLAYIAAESMGESGEKAAREYQEATQAQAKAHPLTTTLSEAGGTILGGAGVEGLAGGLGEAAAHKLGGGLWARFAGRALEGAIAGGTMGEASVHTYDYLAGDTATREKLLAGIGMGATLGAGINVAWTGVGAGAKALRDRFRARFGNAAKPGAASAAALEAAAEEALGEPPVPGFGEKMATLLDDAVSASTGVDKTVVRRVNPLRGEASDRGLEILFNREELLEQAEKRLLDNVSTLHTAADDVLEELRDRGLKAGHVDALLAQRTAAQREVARDSAREMIDQIRLELATALDDAATFGAPKRLRNALESQNRLAAQAVRENTDTAAYMALDQMKREAQKVWETFGEAANRSSDPLAITQHRAAAKLMSDLSERARGFLENETTWGAAGTAQRELNARWVDLLEKRRLFTQNALTATGDKLIPGKGIKRTTYEADPAKLKGYLQKVGTTESKLVDRHFRGYVDALDSLTSKLDETHDIGDKTKLVAQIREAAKATRKTLDDAAETIGFSNQAQKLLAPSPLATSAVLGGAVLGGPAGAALGGVIGAITNPGKALQMAWGVRRLTKAVDARVATGIREAISTARTGTARRAAQAGLSDLPIKPRRLLSEAETLAAEEATGLVIENSDAAAESLGRRALLRAAIHKFRDKDKDEDDQKAYARRREQLAELVSNPYKAHAAIQGTVAPIAGPSAAMTAELTADMSAALMTLQALAPDPARAGFGKGAKIGDTVPRQALETWKQQWEGITSPLSLLDDLREGKLTVAKRDAVKMQYPKLFRQMQGEAAAAIAENPELPHNVRTQFDLLLELNGTGEPSVAPAFLASLAQIAEERNKAAAVPRRPPTGGRLRTADRTRTLTESAQGGT